MRTILNLIWFVFSGIWLAIAYTLVGLLFCVTIVGIPVGVACFRMASYALWPFGRALVDKPGAGAGSILLNIVWLLLAGWWIAVLHLVTALAQSITIVGIPVAIANIKMIPVSLFPFGKQIVPVGYRDPRSWGPEIIGPHKRP